MRQFLLSLSLALASCAGGLSEDEAKRIAALRLSNQIEPPLAAEQIESSLSVANHGRNHLVEFREESKNLMWAVMVKPDGSTEISRTEIQE